MKIKGEKFEIFQQIRSSSQMIRLLQILIFSFNSFVIAILDSAIMSILEYDMAELQRIVAESRNL